jgi:hypothetical protein
VGCGARQPRLSQEALGARYLGWPAPTSAKDAAAAAAAAASLCPVLTEASAGAGVVSTLAGNGTEGFAGAGVIATASEARFYKPFAVAFVAGADVLFVADGFNHAVRVVQAGTGATQTLAGAGPQVCTRVQ